MANDDSFERSTTVRSVTLPLPLKIFHEKANKRRRKLGITFSTLLHKYRFASFIEGGSHLNDEEVLEYETTQLDIDDDDINTSDEDDLMTDSEADK